jgi:hypothetical protein
MFAIATIGRTLIHDDMATMRTDEPFPLRTFSHRFEVVSFNAIGATDRVAIHASLSVFLVLRMDAFVLGF